MQKNTTGSNLSLSGHEKTKISPMQAAMEEARAAGLRGEVPIGAVITHKIRLSPVQATAQEKSTIRQLMLKFWQFV